MSEKYPIFKYPILRGVGTLGQAMSLGIKALRFSANVALDEDREGREKANRRSPRWVMTAQPRLLARDSSSSSTSSCRSTWPPSSATSIRRFTAGIAFNLVDGVIRIAIFLAFLYVLSRMKDIRRVFEYHGAEHKVVFNFESGQPVTVENAQKFTTFHPRCGTSFLLVVMIDLDGGLRVHSGRRLPGRSSPSRIALLPVIAGAELRTDPLRRQAARWRCWPP